MAQGVGTAAEEIARQHDEAIKLSKNMECMEMRERGEIPLTWKTKPTAECAEYNGEVEEKKEEDGRFVVSSRGVVDVSLLAELVREGYDDKMALQTKKKKNEVIKSVDNLWDEANARKNNIEMKRPSHDSWGIKKILLIFCDDFMQKVYEMPWWHLNSRPTARRMQEAVQPILEVLGVPSNRIVRMLLAALPPGVTIPVHHDTGEWVKHTHRVHVPVLVSHPDQVLFRIGPTTHSLQRVSTEPGHVFEINNQAKHVVSNCSPHHRVHLILDYTDPSFPTPPRIHLTPGEKLVQTRRSIDRALDKNRRQTPSYIIIGAQKAGTTSLYHLLNQHPLVVAPKRRETHNLDWRYNADLPTTSEKTEHCQSFYHAPQLQHHPSCLTGDSTPSYLLHSHLVIPRLKLVFPWNPKLIAILRDPVQRAHSHYQMVTDSEGTSQQLMTRGTEWRNLSFEEVIQKDIDTMTQVGLIPYWVAQTSEVNSEIFQNFVGSPEEDRAWIRYQETIPMNTGSHSLLARGMYELNLRPWLRNFPQNHLLVFRLEQLKSYEGTQEVMTKVFQHLELPKFTIPKEDQEKKNARDYVDMDPDTKRLLREFYQPWNDRLVGLLGADWKNVWAYE